MDPNPHTTPVRPLTGGARPGPPPAPAPLRRWRAHAAFLVTGGVLLALIALLTAVFEEVYDSVKDGGGLAALDLPAAELALSLRSDPLTALGRALAFSGGTVGATVVALVLLGLLWWARRDATPFVLLPAAMAGSLAITSVGKDRVGRLRPPHELGLAPFETSPSFPSGHTLNATVLLGIVLYVVLITARVRIGRSHRAAVAVVAAVALLYVAAMGMSRVYLGQHWLTDVAAGWVIGVGWVLGVVFAHRVWAAVRRGRATAVLPGRSRA